MRFFDSNNLENFVAGIFGASGSQQEEAKTVAEYLVDANLAGHDSHGVIRVVQYLDWLSKGWVKANQRARILSAIGPKIVVDGGLGYGQVIAKQGMTLAMERAKSDGICVIAFRNTGHVGRLGAWAELLSKAGLVSLHFANTTGFGIRMAPFGGIERRFSTNPICIGAPVKNGFPVVLDMATAKIPEGKILVAINRGEKLPEGMILDGHGQPTCDPQGFFDEPQGVVLPIAGPKGSGLAFMIEVLAGALTGGGSSHPNNPSATQVVNNLFSIVIDPENLTDESFYNDDVMRLIEWTKSSRPTVPGGEVLVPGEIEYNNRMRRQSLGIPLDDVTIGELEKIASMFAIQMPPGVREAS